MAMMSGPISVLIWSTALGNVAEVHNNNHMYMKHFLNKLLEVPLGAKGLASCAIDCFLDTFYYGVHRQHPKQCIQKDGSLLDKVTSCCKLRDEQNSVASFIRQPVWDWLVKNEAQSFSPMGRGDAVCCDAFVALGKSLNGQKLFCPKITFSMNCSNCLSSFQFDEVGSSLLTISSPSFLLCKSSLLDEAIKEDLIRNCCQMTSNRNCIECGQLCPIDIAFLELPKFMFIELPIDNRSCKNIVSNREGMVIGSEQTIFSESFSVNAAVQLSPGHFKCVVRDTSDPLWPWYCFDDMKQDVSRKSSFTEALHRKKMHLESPQLHTVTTSHDGIHILILEREDREDSNDIRLDNLLMHSKRYKTILSNMSGNQDEMTVLDDMVMDGDNGKFHTSSSKSTDSPIQKLETADPKKTPQGNILCKSLESNYTDELKCSRTIPRSVVKLRRNYKKTKKKVLSFKSSPLSVTKSKQPSQRKVGVCELTITLMQKQCRYKLAHGRLYLNKSDIMDIAGVTKWLKDRGWGPIDEYFSKLGMKKDQVFICIGNKRPFMSLAGVLVFLNSNLRQKTRPDSTLLLKELAELAEKQFYHSIHSPVSRKPLPVPNKAASPFKLSAKATRNEELHKMVQSPILCSTPRSAGFSPFTKKTTIRTKKKQTPRKRLFKDPAITPVKRVRMSASRSAGSISTEHKVKKVRKLLKEVLNNICQGNKQTMLSILSKCITVRKYSRPGKKVTENTDLLNSNDIVSILRSRPIKKDRRHSKSNLLHSIIRKYAHEVFFVQADNVINNQENFHGRRLTNCYRQALPSLVASEYAVRKKTSELQVEFKLIMEPTRSPHGWYVNPMRLVQMLLFTYYWLPNHSEIYWRLYGDGREVGKKQTCSIGINLLNNEAFLHGFKYQSSRVIHTIANFYGSDSRDNLESNIQSPHGFDLNSTIQDLQRLGHTFFLSGDYKFLMALLDDDLSPTSETGWDIYHECNKRSKSDVAEDGLRTSLNIRMDRNFKHNILSAIPLNRVMICVLHGQARIVSKYLDLEIEKIVELANKVDGQNVGGQTQDRGAFLQLKISELQDEISLRGVRKGNFRVIFNGQKAEPISLSRNYARLVINPPSDEFPHPFQRVYTSRTMIRNTMPDNVRQKLGLKENYLEIDLVKVIWEHFCKMNSILSKDPPPVQKEGIKAPSSDIDYSWGYTDDDKLSYLHHAEAFYQLFKVRYGWERFTPYMMLYIDHVPHMMENSPFTLARMMAEGGEKKNHDDQRYYHGHTTHHGCHSDPMWMQLFHEFKNIRYEIGQMEESDDPLKQKAYKDFKDWKGELEKNSNPNCGEEPLSTKPTNDNYTVNETDESTPSRPRTKNPFHRMHFILAGRIPRSEALMKQIVENGGRVYKKLPTQYTAKQYIVLSTQSCVDGKATDILRRAVHRRYPIISAAFIHDKLFLKAVSAEIKDYTLDCRKLEGLVKSRAIPVEDLYFPKKNSLLTRIKKRPSVRNVEKQGGKSLLKAAHNRSIFYARVRRKQLKLQSSSFKEQTQLLIKFNQEWNEMSPNSKSSIHEKWLESKTSSCPTCTSVSTDEERYQESQVNSPEMSNPAYLGHLRLWTQ